MSNTLKKYRVAAKLTQQALADLSGTTKQQIFKLEKGERPITIEWAKRIGPHLGLSNDDLKRIDYFRNLVTDPTQGSGSMLLAAQEYMENMAEEIETKNLPVVGQVAAGVWIEEAGFDVDQSDMERIPVVPDQRFSKYRQYALRVVGESMNKIIRDGEYAICVELRTVRTWVHDDIVVVVRQRYDGHLRETTLKQVAITKKGIELWPRSNDPRFQEPVQLKSSPGDTVEIVALVIATHRPLFK